MDTSAPLLTNYGIYILPFIIGMVTLQIYKSLTTKTDKTTTDSKSTKPVKSRSKAKSEDSDDESSDPMDGREGQTTCEDNTNYGSDTPQVS